MKYLRSVLALAIGVFLAIAPVKAEDSLTEIGSRLAKNSVLQQTALRQISGMHDQIPEESFSGILPELPGTK